MKTSTNSVRKNKMTLLFIASLAAAALSGCAGGDAYESESGYSSSGVLSMNPSTANITAGQSVTFQATGGSGQYTYYMYGGSGVINSSTGVYTGPVAMETDTVEVIDTNGNMAFASVIIGTTSTVGIPSGGLAITPSAVTVVAGNSMSFGASGGTGNYIYSMYGGSGSVTTAGYYTASTSAGTDYVQVTDSSGGKAYATITVTGTGSVPSVTIYSFSSTSPGDHYYATTQTAPSGYTYQKVAFKLFSTNANGGTVALYRCHRTSSGHVHFLSTDIQCAGQVNEATLGYLYQVSTSGFQPLYGYGSANSVDTIDTITPTDGTSLNYYYEGILGYVGAP